MALTIKDILQLQSLHGFQLISGHKGLSRYVTSAGILDYEFSPDAVSYTHLTLPTKA